MEIKIATPVNCVPATSFEEYSTFLDRAIEGFEKPITNVYLSAAEAQHIIDEKRMFLTTGDESACVLIAQPGTCQCLYVADGAAKSRLLLQNPMVPVTLDEIVAGDAPLSTEKAELLERSGFQSLRKTVRLVRKLEPPKMEADVPEVELATIKDVPQILELIVENFDPCKDRIPSWTELTELICHGYVHIVRQDGNVAAVNIALPQGRMVHHHWLAVGHAYRKNPLIAVCICEQRERDAYRRGHTSAMVWVDAGNLGLLKNSRSLGYQPDGRVMYTFVLKAL